MGQEPQQNSWSVGRRIELHGDPLSSIYTTRLRDWSRENARAFLIA